MNRSKISSLVLAALASAAIAGSLSACVPLVVGGAAMGTMMAVDRRTSGAQVEDEGIELRGSLRLHEQFGERAHVSITSYNRQVLLTGEVGNERDKAAAEQLISKVENVKSIVNELAVLGGSSLQQRSADVLTTGKVKASLVDAKDLQAGAFKVVTERGTVYLMGRVTQQEADRATQMVRTIGGVQKVVRIFEIITPQELAQIQAAMTPRPPASAAK